VKFGWLKANGEGEEKVNISIIDRRCGSNIVYGMKDISVVNEGSFMKFAA
jgi:hypothetical protein